MAKLNTPIGQCTEVTDRFGGFKIVVKGSRGLMRVKDRDDEADDGIEAKACGDLQFPDLSNRLKEGN